MHYLEETLETLLNILRHPGVVFFVQIPLPKVLKHVDYFSVIWPLVVNNALQNLNLNFAVILVIYLIEKLCEGSLQNFKFAQIKNIDSIKSIFLQSPYSLTKLFSSYP
jgi:hypothetical protein